MDWDRLAAGENCPFDSPRSEPNDFFDSIMKMRVSTLCLIKNQTYRGHCILIYDPKHAARPDELTEDEWTAFTRDLHKAVSAIMRVCRPDHVNVECLGNQMPHLHWQVIPRYKDDPRWLGPIWTTTPEEMRDTRLPDDERVDLIADLRGCLQ